LERPSRLSRLNGGDSQVYSENTPPWRNKQLSCHRKTARLSSSTEILSTAAYMYKKLHLKWSIAGDFEGHSRSSK